MSRLPLYSALALFAVFSAVHAQTEKVESPRQLHWPEAHLTCTRTGPTVRCTADGDGSVVIDGLNGIHPHGSIAIVSIHERTGLMDTTGHMILPATYYDISPFEGDGPPLFRLSQNDKSSESSPILEGICDATGRILIPLEYEGIRYIPKVQRFVIKQHGKESLLDNHGQPIKGTTYDDIDDPRFSDKADSSLLWTVRQGDQHGAMDPTSGRLVIPLGSWNLRNHGPFILAEQEQDDAQGAFDSQGKPVLPVTTDQRVSWWPEGKLLIVNTSDTSYALDTQLHEVIPQHRFDTLDPLGTRLAAYKDHKGGLLDSQLQIKVPLQYAGIGKITAGPNTLFVPHITDTKGANQFGVIDGDGKVLVPLVWDNLDLTNLRPPASTPGDETRPEVPAYFLVSKNDKSGLLSPAGAVWMPAEFDAITAIDRDDPRLVATKDGHDELIDGWTGKVLLPPIYDHLSLLSGFELIFAVKNGKVGILTETGTPLVPFLYDKYVDSSGMDNDVLLSLGEKTVKLQLHRNPDGSWTAQPASGSVLDAPSDDNPIAKIVKAAITERYLPENYSTEKQVLDGFRNGDLREAVWPGLQLSDTQGFIFFGEFAKTQTPLLPNTFMRCPATDGFALVDAPMKANQEACQNKALRRFTFRRTGPDTLHCEECTSLAIPDTWVRPK
ncbi:WG repeat-containing protein [Granulicella sp. S156]|uniref:WG repeat-containing protein n=1 Tax=Granulicella sp. S156 TaxID=1747224 RepID=UPI00131A9EA2|nr:WG repeat-containing protein [Granulicella sp. S156]